MATKVVEIGSKELNFPLLIIHYIQISNVLSFRSLDSRLLSFFDLKYVKPIL
jgi:hypothetical protein